MLGRQKGGVFLSYARKDGEDFAEKLRARRRDRIRLATGKVTVDELQRENAFIQNARDCKIIDPNPANAFV